MSLSEQEIKKSLCHVERPGRYWGNELNSIIKPSDSVDVRFALGFPDLYEIGMSHVGFSILYHVLNKKEWIGCERVYSPWPDMEEQLRKRGIPLFSLETKTPVREFDIFGITLQYELQYTNVVNMLHLAHIPLISEQRKESDPVVVAGGPCAGNPEPLSRFIDAFVIGDGEEAAIDLAEAVRNAGTENWSRRACVEQMAQIKGVYVPSVHKGTGHRVKARVIENLKEDNYPDAELVPLIEVTHDRYSMEVMRGCTRGCRFCAAGMGYRPVRQREPAAAFKHAQNVIGSTGYEEISLVSLSTSDYEGLPVLLSSLTGGFTTNPVSVAFPSMRPETFTEEMARAAADIRKTSLTLAPEAGTQRLRDVINKNNTEEDLLKAVDIGFRNGFRRVKLYFMIGLPTETDEDVIGIASLIEKVAAQVRQYGRSSVHASISPFSPKAHTPFQWEALDSIEEIDRKVRLVRQHLNARNSSLNWRDPRITFLETVLGRGDAAMGQVIERVWGKGARFDAWSEYFNANFALWQDSFIELGLDTGEYTSAKGTESSLPWDHIDPGVTKEFLLRERELALGGEITPDCRIAGCNGCGLMDHAVCRNMKTRKTLVDWAGQDSTSAKSRIEKRDNKPVILKRVRIAYSKGAEARYTSHRDIMRLFARVLRKSNIRLAYSRGFHAHPRIATGPPLSLGFTSRAEYMDIDIRENIPSALQTLLNSNLPRGIRVFDSVPVERSVESLNSLVSMAVYSITVCESADIEKIGRNIQDFLQQNKYVVKREKKGKVKEVDIRLFIRDIRLEKNRISVYIRMGNTGSARLYEVLQPLFAESLCDYTEADIERVGLYTEKNGKWVTPVEAVLQ